MKNHNSRLVLRIGVATLCRIVFNTARRFVYPFAPVLSRGLGVPLPAVTSLIAVNQFTGILGPFFAPVGDRRGYRIMLLAGLGLLSVGMLAGGFLPFYGVVLVALFMAGLGRNIFDPAIQAYVGDRVPYKRRGLVIGIMEFAWAGSALLGVPLMGLLIESMGWRAPFFVLGGSGLVGLAILGILIPAKSGKRKSVQGSVNPLSAWRQFAKNRAALGVLGFSFFISAANDNFFVIYGAWLENGFGLSVVALGMATMVIGVAELLGEGLTASFSDRLGLRRSAVIGLVLSGVCYALLPLFSSTLTMALGFLFLVFLTVEFSIVTCLSLSTEILPAMRAMMMSGYVAAAGIGRVAGALLGGPVWIIGGMEATAFVSVMISAMGLVSLVWGLKGWRP
ncbi:MAG: MFS transporter [Deltaproteobacteria bacterium]|nr:MFS transporter [Deltaproteobacteria bacterium]MBN2844372.1 MFS transporter [Deltaproteobacteria bacterium]